MPENTTVSSQGEHMDGRSGEIRSDGRTSGQYTQGGRSDARREAEAREARNEQRSGRRGYTGQRRASTDYGTGTGNVAAGGPYPMPGYPMVGYPMGYGNYPPPTGQGRYGDQDGDGVADEYDDDDYQQYDDRDQKQYNPAQNALIPMKDTGYMSGYQTGMPNSSQYPVNSPYGFQPGVQGGGYGYAKDYGMHSVQNGYAPMSPEAALKLQQKCAKILKMNMTGMSSLFDLINRRGELAHRTMQNFHHLSETEKAQAQDQFTHLDAALREMMCL